VKLEIFQQRRRDHTLADLGLDQDVRLVLFELVHDRPDIERRMGPGGLGEVLDDAGNVVVAFDQEYVAGLERAGESVGIAGGERFVSARRLFQIPGKHPPNVFSSPTHDVSRACARWRPRVFAEPQFITTVIAIWFMRQPTRKHLYTLRFAHFIRLRHGTRA
jgi:hypothetical protein